MGVELDESERLLVTQSGHSRAFKYAIELADWQTHQFVLSLSDNHRKKQTSRVQNQLIEVT